MRGLSFAEQVVAEAVTWKGTPHLWQASVKGKGCDCKGLIAGVARGLERPEGTSLEALARDYSRVDPVLLKAGLARLFDRVAGDPAPGDILLLIVGGKPQHLAIMSGPDRMIHTYAAGPGRVIEVPMGRVWRRALDSAWRWRPIEAGSIAA